MEDSPASLLRRLCDTLPLDFGSIASVLKSLHKFPWDDGLPSALIYAVGRIGEAAAAVGEVHECGTGPDELLDICIAALAKCLACPNAARFSDDVVTCLNTEVERSGAAHIASIIAALGAMQLSDGLKVDAAELALLPLQELANSDSADAAFARCRIPASNLLLSYLHGPTVIAGVQPSRALLAITASSCALPDLEGIAVRDLLVRQCMLSTSLCDMFYQAFSSNPLNCCALECALELHRLSVLTPSALSQLCRVQPVVSAAAVVACQDDARVFSCLNNLLSLVIDAHAAEFPLLTACAHAVGLVSGSRPQLQQQLCCSIFSSLFTVALADFASDMSIDLRLSCIGSLVAALFAGFVDRGTASESDPHQITPLPLISALLSGSMTVLHDCVNVLPDAPCVLCLGSILHPDQMVSAGLSIVKHVLGMLPSSDSAALSTRVGIMNAVCKTFMRGSSDDGVVNVSHMRAPHTLLLCDTIVQGGAAAARIPGLVEFIQALLAHHGIEVTRDEQSPVNIRFTWDVESTSWLTDLHETVCVRLWTAWLLLASLEPPPQYVRVLSANFVDDTSTCSQLSVNAWQFPIMPDVIQCTAMQLLFLARTSSVQAALMYRILEAVISSPDSMWPFASERRKCTSRLALQSDAHWRLANCTIGCLRSRILSPPVAWKGPASPSRGSAPAARPSPKRPAPITLTGEDLLASVVQHDLQASMQARKRLMVGGSASARIDRHGDSERAASSPAAISSSPIASDEEQPAESADFETEEKPDGVPAGSVTGAATSRLQWYEARDKKSLSEWCERTESFMRTHGLRPDVGLAVLSLLCPQQDAASISKLSCPAIACLMDTSVSLLADALAARSSASSCLPASASPRIPAVFGVNRPAYFIVTFHHSSAPASVIPGVYEHINLPPPAPEPMQANATPDPVSIVRSWLATGAFKSLAFLVPGVMDVLESARSFPIASGSYRREQWEKAVRASQFEQRAAASLKRKMRSQQVEARRTVRFEARQRKTLAWVPAPISIGADDADAFADGDGAWSGSDAGSDAEADNPVILMHTLCVWEPLLVTLLTSLYNMLLVAQSVGLFEPAVVDLAAGCCAGAVHGPDAATLSLFETLAGLLKKSSFVGVSTALLDLLAVLCITPELQCAFAQLCVAALHLVNPVDCNGAGYIQTRAEAWYFPVFAPRQFAIGEYHVFPVRFLCIPWDQPFSLIRPALPPALDFSVLQQKAELSDVVASLLPDIKATIEKYSSLDWWWDWLCPHYVLRYDCDYGYLRYSLFGMAAWLPRQHHEHALVLLMAHVAHALNRRISNSGTTSVSAPPPRAGRAHSNKDGSSSDEYPFDDDICSDDDEDIDTDEEITRITRYPRSTFASSTPPVLTFWSALRSLTADSLQHYSEVLLCFAIAYLAGCEPGILRNDVRAGVIGSQEDLLSVDEVLAVQVPLQGSSEQLSLTDCVCVMMRRALSILRLCLPLVALTLSQPDTVAHRGARIARTLAVLASVLHAKTAHVLAWRSAPAAAGTERGPQIAPARLRKCFADISATALSVLAVVDSQMRGYAKLSNRTRSTLASIFQLQCGTQPAVSSSVAPATDLQTLPSGDALSSDDVWKRLLLLDPARIPAWHELLR